MLKYVNYVGAVIKVAADKTYDYVNFFLNIDEIDRMDKVDEYYLEEEDKEENKVDLEENKVTKVKEKIKINYDKYQDETKHTRLFKPVSYYEEYSIFFNSPTHIIDNLYLGSAFNAASYYKLKELNINVIINVTKEISHYYPDDFIYINYNVYDNNHDSIQNCLEVAYNKILNYKDSKILIHCYMGASRSASLILYYLMKKEKMTHDDAITFLKKKRSIVNPTFQFTKDVANAINL